MTEFLKSKIEKWLGQKQCCEALDTGDYITALAHGVLARFFDLRDIREIVAYLNDCDVSLTAIFGNIEPKFDLKYYPMASIAGTNSNKAFYAFGFNLMEPKTLILLTYILGFKNSITDKDVFLTIFSDSNEPGIVQIEDNGTELLSFYVNPVNYKTVIQKNSDNIDKLGLEGGYLEAEQIIRDRIDQYIKMIFTTNINKNICI